MRTLAAHATLLSAKIALFVRNSMPRSQARMAERWRRNVFCAMNRITVLCCLAAFLPAILMAQFSAIGGTRVDRGTDVATDAVGNVYVAMTFQGTIDFDKGPAENIRFSLGDTTDPRAVDVAILKYSPDLALLWVVTFGSPGEDVVHAIRLAPNGDVILAGAIGGTVYDLDPSDTVKSLFGHVGRDAFVARYSSDGQYRWAYSFGDEETDPIDVRKQEDAFDCDVDVYGNVFVTGCFNGEIDLDPTSDSASLVFTSNNSSKDVWLASFGPDGTFRWAKTLGGIGRDEGHGIRVHNGDVVIAGCFSNAIDVDFSANVRECVSNGGMDAFIVRYDSNLVVQWTTSFGAAGYDDQVRVGCLDVSSTGDASISGEFGGTVDLDRGPSVVRLTSKGLGDVFYVRYAPDSSIVRSFNVGGAGNDRANRIRVDAEGGVYLTGGFQTVADFDPSSGVLSLQAGGVNGAFNAFVAKYSRDGDVRWATSFGAELNGDSSITEGRGLAIDDINGVWATGAFLNAIDISPGTSKFYLRSAGANDAFLLHYEPNGGLNLGLMTSVRMEPRDESEVLQSAYRGNLLYAIYTVDGRNVDATLQQLQRGTYYVVVYTEHGASTLPILIR